MLLQQEMPDEQMDERWLNNIRSHMAMMNDIDIIYSSNDVVYCCYSVGY